MASKRNQRRRGCQGKRKHEKQEDAVWARTNMMRMHGVDVGPAYKCPFCGGWHNGHTPNKYKGGGKMKWEIDRGIR